MGFFSATMLAELQRPGCEVYKRLTINFPPQREILYLSPDATEHADTSHQSVGAATFHEVLDDPHGSPDDDSSYVENINNDAMAESMVSFPDLPTTVDQIHRVGLYVRARSNVNASNTQDDGSWTFALRVNGTNYYGQNDGKRFYSAVYKTMGIWFDENPDEAPGTAWTPAAVNALIASFISQPDGFGDSGGQRFTQIFLAVEVSSRRTGRYSDIAINSRTDGLFAAKVLRWGKVPYAVSPASGAIQRPNTQVDVDDMDEELSQIFAAGGYDEIRRSTATIEYISPNVPRADWATIFTGILSTWQKTATHAWTLGLSVDDSSLNGKFPKAKFNERDFDNADSKVYDLFYQYVLGRQDSEGIANDGMVLCPNVDKALFRRFVSVGIMKRIIRVYSKGNDDEPPLLRTEGVSTGNALTAQYQVIYPIINGRQMTLLEFYVVGAQTVLDNFNELTITADVDGLDELSDGTGVLMTNPADLLRWFYVNLVRNDWRSGEYFDQTTDAPIDNTFFDETRDFFNLVGQASSRVLGGEGNAETVRAEMNRWAEDLNTPLFWTEAGKIAARPNTPFTLDFYIDHPWIIEGLHDLEEPQVESDDSALFDRMLVAYLHQHNGERFLSNIEIFDSAVGEEKTETFEAKWLPSSLTPGGEVAITSSVTPGTLTITGKVPVVVGPS